jgi:hypothetical protein
LRADQHNVFCFFTLIVLLLWQPYAQFGKKSDFEISEAIPEGTHSPGANPTGRNLNAVWDCFFQD